jgi:protein TonB
MKMKMNNRGLLSLGLIFSLGLTLTGFEYISSDTKYTKKRMAKAEFIEDETVFIPEIPKPEVPKPEVPNKNPMTQPSPIQPVNPIGPIEVSPIDPVDPVNPVWEPGVDPIDTNIGKQTFVYDPPKIPAGFLDEFPTYEEFLPIKEKNERREKTENKMQVIVFEAAGYPYEAQLLGLSGIIHVSFQVDTDGNITNVQAMNSIHPSLDKAAVNAVKRLPKMIPGKKLDKPVISTYTMPVKFVLK